MYYVLGSVLGFKDVETNKKIKFLPIYTYNLT